ncbi:MAG: SDR family oxidoreductase [Pseudomonadota bacterium]|nr:SDR family oxidoreductase [Pseudomonadota bacterium]
MKNYFLIVLILLPFGQSQAVDFRDNKPTILITGANRGLGLEFARQYAALDWNVIASCRSPRKASELKKLAQDYPYIAIEKLDVTKDRQVKKLAKKYSGQAIDVLLNNAGIYGTLEKQTLGTFDYEELKLVFDVNTIGSLRVTEAFLGNVRTSEQKKIISLGGGMGTPTIGRMFGGHYFMKMSKAAHLSAMGTLDTDLKDSEILIVMISPGRVDTQLMRDSGWTGPSISADASAKMVISLIDNLEPEMNGRLVLYNGNIVPW